MDRSKQPTEAEKQQPPATVVMEDSEESESESDSESDYEEEEQQKMGSKKPTSSAKEVRAQEQESEAAEDEDEALWDFPPDPEHWDEWDLGEEWADATSYDKAPGRDPELAEDDPERYKEFEKAGNAPPIRPYYVPYRRHYPMVPDNHPDIETPEAVVEELERMEEFLQWASYIFKDGSSYEGTVWNDFAHGKGVYTTPLELCRYEGEWMQNMMEGHGVIEVHLPVPRYPPGSELDKREREKGVIYSSDFMSAEDKEWLKMDIEDTLSNPRAFDSNHFEDDPLWIKYFGELPEKGRYKYAGQWKRSRMHGCGVYEVNGRQIWGKFYFGELMPDEEECTFEQSALHSSLAEVAAAKARMFVNKPDGMVREVKGPFNDPQHPYLYEEEDLWMAPGFINAYYEVPDFWKGYVEEVDEEQEMWLNSFIKSPLRIPMPPELEHFWSKDDKFILLHNTPTSALAYDPENVIKAKEGLEGEVLLHVPTGRIINWANDKDGNLQLFWQPLLDDGSVRPEKVVPLPLGFDEFLGDIDKTKKGSDKKKTRKEIFQRKWDERIQKLKEKWKQQDEERSRKWQEEDTEMETEMKLRREEAKLMEQIEEEEFRAEIRAIEEHEELLKKGIVDESSEENDHTEGEAVTQSAKDANQSSEDATSTGNKKQGKGGEGGNGEDGDEEEEEEEDEDDKPRSFGKVAFVEQVVLPIGSKQNPENPQKLHPFFPTAFASLSLSSWFNPPPFLAKPTMSKVSVAHSNVSPTSLTPAVSIKRVKLKNNNQSKVLRAVIHSGGLTSSTSSNLLATFSAKSVLSIRREPLFRVSRGKRANQQGRSKQKKRGNPSWPTMLPNAQDIWTFPGIDFLSMAIPLNM